MPIHAPFGGAFEVKIEINGDTSSGVIEFWYEG